MIIFSRCMLHSQRKQCLGGISLEGVGLSSHTVCDFHYNWSFYHFPMNHTELSLKSCQIPWTHLLKDSKQWCLWWHRNNDQKFCMCKGNTNRTHTIMPCDDLTLHVITPYIPPRYHTWNQMLNTLILNELLLKKTLSTLSYRPKAMIAYSYARALWTFQHFCPQSSLKGLLKHQNIFETSGSQKGPLGSRSKISLEEFYFRSVDITLPGFCFQGPVLQFPASCSGLSGMELKRKNSLQKFMVQSIFLARYWASQGFCWPATWPRYRRKTSQIRAGFRIPGATMYSSSGPPVRA